MTTLRTIAEAEEVTTRHGSFGLCGLLNQRPEHLSWALAHKPLREVGAYIKAAEHIRRVDSLYDALETLQGPFQDGHAVWQDISRRVKADPLVSAWELSVEEGGVL